MSQEKVILTLSTIPERLSFIHPLGLTSVIYSLLNIKYNNYEIHFNIPYKNKKTDKEYIIPDWLSSISSKSILKIFRTEDFGSITKLYPTLERIKDPNQLIIVVDDDLIYESRLILEHISLRQKNDDAVWGFAGLNNKGEKHNDARDRFVIGVNHDTRVGIIEHYKSVSYRRKFFSEDFDQDFLKRGWSDDHLISAYMGMKNIPKIVGQTDYIKRHKDITEWRSYGVVESFPVVKHSVTQSRSEGCNLFRLDKQPPLEQSLEKFLV